MTVKFRESVVPLRRNKIKIKSTAILRIQMNIRNYLSSAVPEFLRYAALTRRQLPVQSIRVVSVEPPVESHIGFLAEFALGKKYLYVESAPLSLKAKHHNSQFTISIVVVL